MTYIVTDHFGCCIDNRPKLAMGKGRRPGLFCFILFILLEGRLLLQVLMDWIRMVAVQVVKISSLLNSLESRAGRISWWIGCGV